MSQFIEDQFGYSLDLIKRVFKVNYSFEPEGCGYTNVTFEIIFNGTDVTKFIEHYCEDIYSEIKSLVESNCENDSIVNYQEQKSIAKDMAIDTLK